MDEFIARSSGQTVRVRTPQPDLLTKAVSEAAARAGADGTAASGATVTAAADGSLTVHGLTAAQIGDLAFEHGVRLHELTVVRASLEEAFMELTADSVEYRAAQDQAGQGGQGGPEGRRAEPGADDQPSLGVPAGTGGQPSAEGQHIVEGRI